MKKGFTLIELLVVIAILAILATVIVVIINPGELLKQARDTTRISDLAAVNSAIAFYLSDVATPGIGGASNAACTAGATSTLVQCTTAGTSPFSAGTSCSTNAVTTVDGNGWAAVTFSSISSGSPLARLPLDPAQTTTYFYAYACGGGSNALNYELDARMESNKYASSTANVVAAAKDGGDNDAWYEIGNSLTQ
ncbi:MAG: type II secretion system protein [Candidatus Paceibacterota bacterium]|jgi:prepilin-type N-terminal cleavage/methylation domain-containing protein